MRVSGSRPESVTRPPWISFLFEPVYTALEQATARVRDLEGEIRRLDPEHFRRLKEGTNVPPKTSKESTPEVDPEDLRWLASEQRRIDAQRDRELSELQRVLEERLGAAAVDSIIGGADPLDLCRAAGIEITADLERILERLKGYQEDEG